MKGLGRGQVLGGVLALASAGGLFWAIRSPGSEHPAEGEPRLPEPGQEPTPAPDELRIRLVHADGTPAAGIEAYGVTVDRERPLERLTVRRIGEDADSTEVSLPERRVADADGSLRIGRALILAVRLTPDAVALLPVHGDGETLELPEVSVVELVLDVPDRAGELQAEIALRSAELPAWMVADRRAPEGGFAHNHEVHGWSLAEPRVFVWRALRLTTHVPVQLRLPRGSYAIADQGCTPGWWVRATSFAVGSDSKVLVKLYKPPTAELSCLDPTTGRRRIPGDVSLRFLRTSYDTSWNGGWPLRWRIDGETIHVALENREGSTALGGESDLDDLYGLTVTWSDGARSATGLMERAELAGPVDLVDAARR